MAAKLAIRSTVRVRDGVLSPDFPEISFAGWTGTIVEVSKKKSGTTYILEWSDATLDSMPTEYVDPCEEDQLFHRMACLTADEIEAID